MLDDGAAEALGFMQRIIPRQKRMATLTFSCHILVNY